MENIRQNLERKRILEVAQEYRDKGYEVAIEPTQDSLPGFLADYRPDILARDEHETVVVEVKSRTSLAELAPLRDLARVIEERRGWRLELVVVNPGDEIDALHESRSLSESDIVRESEEAEELLGSGHTEAALLLAWSVTEATLRSLARSEAIAIRRKDPPYLLKQLAVHAAISQEEYNLLMQALKLRNQVAHGFKPEKLDPSSVRTLLRTSGQLRGRAADARTA